MYLWKYWRESRITFGVSLLLIAAVFVTILRSQQVFNQQIHWYDLRAGLPAVLTVQAFPVCFVAWLFGSFGVGRDIGERSASYLFSRPRSRGFFVWRDWGFGLAQLLVLVTALNVAIGFELHRILVIAGDPFHGSILLDGQPVSLVAIVALNCVAGLLLAAVVFSLTYFSTILVRNAKGGMLAAGVLLAYLISKAIAQHYWPWIELPGLIPGQFAISGQSVTGFANNLGLWMAVRAGVILLFPIAAQVLLQKRDIE